MSRLAAYAIVDNLNGTDIGQKKYQKIIGNDFDAYQIKKQEYYNQETRFISHPFWKRRQTTKQSN